MKSENVTKTLPNIANPHIRIYRELLIGQQVLASIEDGWTHTQTDVAELYIRCDQHLMKRYRRTFVYVMRYIVACIRSGFRGEGVYIYKQ